MTKIPIKTLLENASQQLAFSSTTPRLDAELLLAHLLKKDRIYLLSHSESYLSEEQFQQWQLLLQQREQQFPLAYLTGEKEFWSLTLEVNEHTLIPRPETELLIELLLRNCEHVREKEMRFLDLGTGTGAIALAVAKEYPAWRVTALDISLEALCVAKRNAKKNHLSRVVFLLSDWFSILKNSASTFDIIVSNPPYLAANDEHLRREEIRYEPYHALVAEKNGLGDIEKIIAEAPYYLTPDGQLFLEHGYEQGRNVRALLKNYGYYSIKTNRDLAGLERATQGIRR